MEDLYRQEDCSKGAFDLISSVNKEAYNNVFLLSNQVLSKNTVTNSFLARYLNNERSGKKSILYFIYKLVRYYFYSFKDFLSYLKELFQYFLSKARFRFNYNKKLILIDTFFIIEKIKTEGRFYDRYFPGLAELLKKNGFHFAYLPMLDGMRSGFTLLKILKILKKENIPVLYEYQLLSLPDLLKLAGFILIYPFSVLRLVRQLSSLDDKARLLGCELSATLDQVSFRNFSRYLQGKKIARLPYGRIQVISWYENQAGHKNLYKGLRADPLKVKICGAQLFLYSKNLLNINPDENELDKEIVPDKILVNGPAFVPDKSRLNYDIGPSLRYFRVFNNQIQKKSANNILISLPYFEKDIQNILKIINGLDGFSYPIILKFHSATRAADFRRLIPLNAFIADADIYKLFETTKILVSTASGTLIEAVCQGIPAISIKRFASFDCNPLPVHGKGIIWEEAATAEDLKLKIDKFARDLENNYAEIMNLADSYKKLYFLEPSEENMIKSFGLNGG